MNNRPFLFQIAASLTNVCDIMLTSLRPYIQSCSNNFDKGRRGNHKHKIIDRPLSQNKVHYISSTFATGCRFA